MKILSKHRIMDMKDWEFVAMQKELFMNMLNLVMN